MKIRFVRPLPRIDHVIPAGFILDAPEGFAHKMIRTGRALPVTGGSDAPTLEDTDRGISPEPLERRTFANPFDEEEQEEKPADIPEREDTPAEEPPKKPVRPRKGN